MKRQLVVRRPEIPCLGGERAVARAGFQAVIRAGLGLNTVRRSRSRSGVDLLLVYPLAVLDPVDRHHRGDGVAVGIEGVRTREAWKLGRVCDRGEDLCPGWEC